MNLLPVRLPSLCALVFSALLWMVWPAHGEEHVRHPFLAAQSRNAPEEVMLAVEIPAGSFTKYEINEEGLVYVDRFQSMPVAYPANYGSMPRTLAGDGDPLDALVLLPEPVFPGCIVEARPVFQYFPLRHAVPARFLA